MAIMGLLFPDAAPVNWDGGAEVEGVEAGGV
jgi:hypothetical protein